MFESALSIILTASASANVVFAVAVPTLLYNCAGVPTRLAHVAPVAVPASNSVCVASSTLPATVVVASGCVDPALTAYQDHHRY
jgi:hypothetical protein